MRIWDISPGYLNRQSLLGEHRELHALAAVLAKGKGGYAKHPETLRWKGYGWALSLRHRQVAREMALRGYIDKSPLMLDTGPGQWPDSYVDPPQRQFQLLAGKYQGKEAGRIPLPKNAQQLWSQHKYSVMARDPGLYQSIGRQLSQSAISFDELARRLTEQLRVRPSEGGLRNAVQHMWGYVSDPARGEIDVEALPLGALLRETQKRARENAEPYLMASTALADLSVWLPDQ